MVATDGEPDLASARAHRSWWSEWREENRKLFDPRDVLGRQADESVASAVAWSPLRLVVYLLFLPIFIVMALASGPIIGASRASRTRQHYAGRGERVAAAAWGSIGALWVLLAIAVLVGAWFGFAAII